MGCCTEVKEAPGVGPNQAPRQAKPNTGPDENGVIHPIDDGFKYPAVSEVVRINITPLGDKAGQPVSAN